MTPLGIGIGMGAPTWGNYMITIEDKYWQPDPGDPSGSIEPLDPEIPIIPRVHDTWDLDGNDYMPREMDEVLDEGFWDVETVVLEVGTRKDIKPIDPANFDAA